MSYVVPGKAVIGLLDPLSLSYPLSPAPALSPPAQWGYNPAIHSTPSLNPLTGPPELMASFLRLPSPRPTSPQLVTARAPTTGSSPFSLPSFVSGGGQTEFWFPVSLLQSFQCCTAACRLRYKLVGLADEALYKLALLPSSRLHHLETAPSKQPQRPGYTARFIV